MTCGTTSSQVSSEPDRLASFVALIATLRKSAFLLCKFVALVIFCGQLREVTESTKRQSRNWKPWAIAPAAHVINS